MRPFICAEPVLTFTLYHLGKAGEFLLCVFQDVAVVSRMDDRKPLPVVAVGVCAELMLDLVCLEIGQAADLKDAVFRHSRIPHQVAARLHIIHIRE